MPFDNSTTYESKSVDEFHFSVPIDLDTLWDDLQEESSQTESYDVDLSLSEQQSETYQYNLSYQETSNEETISSPNKSESKDEESIDTPIPLEDILNNDYHMSQDVVPKVIQSPNSYGVGMDVHNKFIVVTVLVQHELEVLAFTKEFGTDYAGIRDAYFWVIAVIEENSSPPVEVFPLHYCLESTATMHYPIIKIWGGNPAVVNPTMAKAGRRKSDIIDSVQLARFDMDGAWPRTYVISDEIHELRVLINEREHFTHLATQCNNRIINILTRFGCTLCREGSITSNPELRTILEDLISENPTLNSPFCPSTIPVEVRAMLREELSLYDSYKDRVSIYRTRMLEVAKSMIWETDEGTITGDEAITLLMTAPQIGEVTAVVFLANIITPRRFSTPKALAAYCGLDPSVQVSAGKKTSKRGRGGNKSLHKVMTSAANRLLGVHSELFGKWGYNLMLKGTTKNKCRNAIARRLAVSMYYMLKFGKEFSYDKYTLTEQMVLLDIPINDLVLLNPGFKRYINILRESGIETSADLIRDYLGCKLDHINGLGRKFFSILKDLVNNQRKYKNMYIEIKNNQGE